MRAQGVRLHAQAEAERERWGLKERSLSPLHGWKPVQCTSGGRVVQGNHRGHPEFKKPPGYTFSASSEVRDAKVKRFSTLSHVRSTSALDVPGPGHYIGQHEQDALLRRVPNYSMRHRHTGDYTPPPASAEQSRQKGEMERLMKRAGARRGEVTVSLMWNTPDDLDLHVVPPGGARGSNEISWSSPQLLGGRLDVFRDRDPGRKTGESLESASWPRFLGMGKDPPPLGEYEAYFVASSLAQDVMWVCRICVGLQMTWLSGIARKGDGQIQVSLSKFRYSGPVDSSTKIQAELGATQRSQPQWKQHQKVPPKKGLRGTPLPSVFYEESTPDTVGPGLYHHVTAFA